MKKLGVNVDHVATLRNARQTVYPDPVEYARLCQLAGADNITFHLREDRRHIKDDDVLRLRDGIEIDLNFEMACTEEMLALALQVKPAVVTFVPEKREELTTEGGLNLNYNRPLLQKATDQLCEHGVGVSYFIEPNRAAIDQGKEMGATAIEIHTGDYAHRFGTEPIDALVADIGKACDHGFELGLDVHAGHGLHQANLAPLLAIDTLASFQIGHAIVSDSLVYGAAETIKRYRMILNP